MELNIKDMTAEQIADATAQIEVWEARQQVKKLVWKSEYGDWYFYPCADGSKSRYTWEEDDFDNNYYKHGNVMTDEIATYTIETCATIHQIHEWIDENDAERGGRFVVGNNNYQIIYRASEDALSIWCTTDTIYDALIPYFSSIEKLRQCINDIGVERIKLLFKRYDIVRGDK